MRAPAKAHSCPVKGAALALLGTGQYSASLVVEGIGCSGSATLTEAGALPRASSVTYDVEGAFDRCCRR